jgi:hypothetical protein
MLADKHLDHSLRAYFGEMQVVFSAPAQVGVPYHVDLELWAVGKQRRNFLHGGA